MVSPSTSPVVVTVAVSVSVELTGSGERTIVGAGGGGFLMLYCPSANKTRLRKALSTSGLREMSYDFDFEGTKVLVNL